ncbi:hypothetical protein ABPG77_011262 [Micractinium sp. CCAP 211/92]
MSRLRLGLCTALAGLLLASCAQPDNKDDRNALVVTEDAGAVRADAGPADLEPRRDPGPAGPHLHKDPGRHGHHPDDGGKHPHREGRHRHEWEHHVQHPHGEKPRPHKWEHRFEHIHGKEPHHHKWEHRFKHPHREGPHPGPDHRWKGHHPHCHGWWHALKKRTERWGDAVEGRLEGLGVAGGSAAAVLGIACLGIGAGALAAWLLHRRWVTAGGRAVHLR